MTTLQFAGKSAETVFLESLQWGTRILGQGERPLGSGTEVFHRPAAAAGGELQIQILDASFQRLKNLAADYAAGLLATLSEPAIGLTITHRATGTVQVSEVRVGNSIARWRLNLTAVEQ